MALVDFIIGFGSAPRQQSYEQNAPVGSPTRTASIVQLERTLDKEAGGYSRGGVVGRVVVNALLRRIYMPPHVQVDGSAITPVWRYRKVL